MAFANLARRLTQVLASSLAALLLLGFLSPYWAAADSLAHFRFHLAAALALAAVLLLILRQWRAGAVAGAVTLAGFIGLAPAFPFWVPAVGGEPVPAITLVQLNLSFRNRSAEAVAELIRAEGADIVTLQEVTGKTGRVLELLGDDYPHRVVCPFARVGSVAVLSRLEPAAGPPDGCVAGGGLAWLRVVAGDRVVSVASVHLHWPYPFGQPTQIDRLDSRLREVPRPVLVAGDFNAAPWSHAVGRVAAATETRVAGGLRLTFDLQPLTWAPALSLPIDHVLLPDGITPAALRMGPGPGSDHRSVIARLAIAPGPQTEDGAEQLVRGPAAAD